MNSDGSSLLFRDPASRVRRTPLRDFLGELKRRVTRGRSFDCLVSDDRELRALNRQFRGKNHATDVLSFPNPSNGAATSPNRAATSPNRAATSPNRAATSPNRAATRGSGAFLGEIAISLDRARAQASEHGHSLDDELRILMLHGALHLAGLDHESDNGEMARAERRWRKHFGLPAGLIDRTRESTHA